MYYAGIIVRIGLAKNDAVMPLLLLLKMAHATEISGKKEYLHVLKIVLSCFASRYVSRYVVWLF